jgi:hypothetical protein
MPADLLEKQVNLKVFGAWSSVKCTKRIVVVAVKKRKSNCNVNEKESN